MKREERRSRFIKRRTVLSWLVLSVVAAVAAGAGGVRQLGPGAASASSHREAPYTSKDPTADNTDVYAFRSPDNPDTVTLVRQEWRVPETMGFGEDVLVPLRAGETIPWKLA